MTVGTVWGGAAEMTTEHIPSAEEEDHKMQLKAPRKRLLMELELRLLLFFFMKALMC